MPKQLKLNLSPDEALDTLNDVLAVDEEIDRLEIEIVGTKYRLKELKIELQEVQARRAQFSRKVRGDVKDATASLPLGGSKAKADSRESVA